MPRARRRVVICDCLDCVDPFLQSPINNFGSQIETGEAAARQEPPPKCLLIFGSGVLVLDPERPKDSRLSAFDSVECPHLDGIAREGYTGFHAVLKGTNAGAYEGEAAVNTIAQILGIYKDLMHGNTSNGSQNGSKPSTLKERFMGMQGAIVSQRKQILEVGEKAGLNAVSMSQNGYCENDEKNGKNGQPSPSDAALQVGELLGYVNSKQEANFLGPTMNELDLAVLHVDAQSFQHPPLATSQENDPKNESPLMTDKMARFDASCSCIEWIDDLIREIDRLNGFRENVLVCVVFSTMSDKIEGVLRMGGGNLVNGEKTGGKVARNVSRPKQTFEFQGMNEVDVELDYPLMVLRRLKGVVRQDEVTKCSIDQVSERGADRAILVERLMAEIAYKLARAPKYGA